IPLRVGLIAADGALLASHLESGTHAPESRAREEHALVLDQPEQTFVFSGVVKAPIPSLLRGFSAPVTLDDGLNGEARLAQMAHEPDPFTRWEAGQSIARAIMLGDAEAPASALIAALGRELDRAQQDAAFAALALRLPDLNELIQVSTAPDPDKLFAARE